MLPSLLSIVACFAQLNDVDSKTVMEIAKKTDSSYIAEVTSSNTQSIIFEFILLLFVIFISVWEISRCEAENEFIEDFYNVVFEEDKNLPLG